ncbi:MAG TPA: putative porin [Candidatus Binatia bacterium]|nr:putative porin [Candidatus Binatia bacterium]
MTLLAGATATAVLATHATPARAEVAGDTLINKLEQKGILTSDEAKELRKENQEDYNNSIEKSFGKFTGTPSWVTGYKISGDFRGRFDQISVTHNDNAVNRARFRYRLRFGIVANIVDNMEVGFRLGSGDSGGNSLSNNTTLENNATKKPIWIDEAYGKWTAINNGDWLLAATIGKMGNPFNFTPMVFDPDLTPEGAAVTGGYTINDNQNISFTGAGFVLDEESGSTRDPFMYGGQVALNSKWNSKLSSSVGVGAFQIVNPSQLTTGNVPYNNRGNSRSAAGVLLYNYNPIIADASLTYTFDKAPLYTGKFPVKVAGEYINNPGAGQDNNGYWAGVTFGKSGKKNTWDLSYRYEYLEADAWYDQVVDDDNAAYYQNAPSGGGSAGVYGGTNLKGHLVKLNYSITDYLTFTLTGYITDVINNKAYNNVSEPNSSTVHFMADVMWKF